MTDRSSIPINLILELAQRGIEAPERALQAVEEIDFVCRHYVEIREALGSASDESPKLERGLRGKTA